MESSNPNDSEIPSRESTAHPRNSTEDTEDGPEFSDFFSLRRPKDARAGLASGMKSIAKGVVGGTASLVAAPALFASQDGWKGLGKGLVVGVTSAAVLPMVGVVVGAAQIVRGVCNTPEAIVETTRGRHWDELKREWVDEVPMPLATEEQIYGRSRGLWRQGEADSAGYYELLEVPHDASPDQIKRQYYFLARKYHPDKNLDDPDAGAKFQKLGEAYQILANPQLRERYDRDGTSGLDDARIMDGVEFYGMLFGCEQFEYLVGELFLATSARLSGDIFDPSIKKYQVERVEKLATNLKALLERWVHGDTEGFLLAQREEANRLSQLSFGKTMLFTIGRIYEHQGTIYQGDIFQSTMARMRQKGESIRSHIQAASLTVRALQFQHKIDKEDGTQASGSSGAKAGVEEGDLKTPGVEEKSEMEDEEMKEGPAPDGSNEDGDNKMRMQEEALPLVLEAMWAANVLDIQNTLKKVCKRVLTNIDRQLIRKRAEGLKEMGKIFVEAGTPQAGDQQGVEAAKETIQNAMQKMAEKRHHMDDQMYAYADD